MKLAANVRLVRQCMMRVNLVLLTMHVLHGLPWVNRICLMMTSGTETRMTEDNIQVVMTIILRLSLSEFPSLDLLMERICLILIHINMTVRMISTAIGRNVDAMSVMTALTSMVGFVFHAQPVTLVPGVIRDSTLSG